MPLRPKKSIAGLTRCVHGGFDHAEIKSLEMDISKVLDFSVCTNPFMPPPGIKKAISSASIEQYPDSQSSLLRQKLAEKLVIDENNILVGSGTTELIRLTVQVYFQQNENVLILEPTYGEYEVACRFGDTHPIKYRAAVRDGFRHRVEGVTATIRKKKPCGIFICNPNNPTGQYFSRNDIEKVMETMRNGLVIIDEAYELFVEKRWNSLDLIKHGNVIILRSMTKDYGLPGLRLGYAVSGYEIIDSLRAALPPWNVNVVAQQAGMAVLENERYLQESLRKTREASEFLLKEISRVGLKTLPSDTHYFLVNVGNATECRQSLLAKGILVRDCSSFGLPEYIRISPRTIPECRKLISALGGIM